MFQGGSEYIGLGIGRRGADSAQNGKNETRLSRLYLCSTRSLWLAAIIKCKVKRQNKNTKKKTSKRKIENLAITGGPRCDAGWSFISTLYVYFETFIVFKNLTSGISFSWCLGLTTLHRLGLRQIPIIFLTFSKKSKNGKFCEAENKKDARCSTRVQWFFSILLNSLVRSCTLKIKCTFSFSFFFFSK